ncbi:MAG TPA: fused isobutyryl-CoA mutase/GTPase IcmF [Acidimicrobiales bacterium]|nr:fused isobutyryl-CoA mutase/GTPase IcmF [Acidimicrobiales bacterium]
MTSTVAPLGPPAAPIAQVTPSPHLEPADPPALHIPKHPVRFVTAASLFDGHDAAINVIRRLLQAQGAEVVHLGHNRSVDEVVTAAAEEDAQGVAVSSYQGGHVEYYKYLLDKLREAGRPDIRVYGGGGGVIVASEIAELEAYGASHIFSPADGQRLGLARMVNLLIEECDTDLACRLPRSLEGLYAGDSNVLARVITAAECGTLPQAFREEITARARQGRRAPVLGVTGTGGSGKSSLTDELIRRALYDLGGPLRIAVLAIDPSRRRGGGALLGDRIRMNAVRSPEVFFRSMAARNASAEVPPYAGLVIDAYRAAGFGLVIVETPGTGQAASAIVDVSDVSLYVMTPEFGAPSQLEKIDMIELADAVAVNKSDCRGSADALRHVRRQRARSHQASSGDHQELAVFATTASRLDDEGVTALYRHLLGALAGKGLDAGPVRTAPAGPVRAAPAVRKAAPGAPSVVPPARQGYLAEIAATVRGYHAETARQAELLRRAGNVAAAAEFASRQGRRIEGLAALAAEAAAAVSPAATELADSWAVTARAYSAGEMEVCANGTTKQVPLTRRSLSGTPVPRVALPRFTGTADIYRWLRGENLPGRFPYTAGVFPFRSEAEPPTRMFAGEGGPQRANRRFHLLADGQPTTRLSTAFDPVTLYGCDPDARPDIYGKIGTSGVSVATLDDMAALFSGFDLCDPLTSVSMTINGPAPAVLAMFFNAAVDQALARFAAEHGRLPNDEEACTIKAFVLSNVRGTVQADILKEDQGQNTCIFSTDFSLRVMGDMEEYFVRNSVRNFYSVSISGYHIAEAGANPVTQLAFTLANGFTYVEAYLARGMGIDDFASNLSFFFSNGMDPEYTVIGRVARRIWAIAMRDRYGASERSQRLKYHVQTSGRSLHAQEMAFNDIRTTLQALCAVYDNANSLHTNAFDEAVTTPTAASLRRALAVQLIINNEWGLAQNENPLQGSFVVEQLTDLVEEAVLEELERISERGGVLGAMETGYQRGRIQDDSLQYEQRKHDGSLPIVGVNTFVNPAGAGVPEHLELARSTEGEKRAQLAGLQEFQARHAAERPGALAALQEAVLSGANVFEELMKTVRCASLGEITNALYEVGGSYRRNV